MKEHAVRRRLAGTGASRLVGLALRVIENAAILGLLARSWTVGYLADWLVLISVSSYAYGADFGLGIYYANLLARYGSRGEWARFASLYRRALAAISSLVAAGILVSVAIVLLCPVAKWLGITTMATADGKVVLILLAASSFVGGMASLLNRSYRAILRAERGQWLLNLASVAQLAVSLLVVWSSGGPIEVASIRLAIGVGLVLAYALDLRRFVPQGTLRLDFSSIRAWRHDIPASVSLFLVQSTGPWVKSISIAVVSHFYGAAATAPFVAAMMLGSAATGVIKSASSGLWQEFSHWAHSDTSMLRMIVDRSSEMTLGLGMLGGIWVALNSRTLLGLWLGTNAPELPPEAVVLLGLYVLSETAVMIPFTLLMTMNRVRSLLLAALLMVLSTMILMVALGPKSSTLFIVMPVSNICALFLLVSDMCREARLSVRTVLRNQVRALSMSLLMVCYVAYLLLFGPAVSGMKNIVFSSMLCMLSMCLLLSGTKLQNGASASHVEA